MYNADSGNIYIYIIAIQVQSNPYKTATLGEMDCGRLMEVETIKEPLLGLWLLAA